MKFTENGTPFQYKMRMNNVYDFIYFTICRDDLLILKINGVVFNWDIFKYDSIEAIKFYDDCLTFSSPLYTSIKNEIDGPLKDKISKAVSISDRLFDEQLNIVEMSTTDTIEYIKLMLNDNEFMATSGRNLIKKIETPPKNNIGFVSMRDGELTMITYKDYSVEPYHFKDFIIHPEEFAQTLLEISNDIKTLCFLDINEFSEIIKLFDEYAFLFDFFQIVDISTLYLKKNNLFFMPDISLIPTDFDYNLSNSLKKTIINKTFTVLNKMKLISFAKKSMFFYWNGYAIESPAPSQLETLYLNSEIKPEDLIKEFKQPTIISYKKPTKPITLATVMMSFNGTTDFNPNSQDVALKIMLIYIDIYINNILISK